MVRKQRKHSTSVLQTPPPPKPPVKASRVSSSPSMLDSLKQGFGFGAGIEMARGIIGSIFPKEEPKAYSFQDNDIISEECKPYFFIRSAGFPLSPNLSLTATNSIGTGWFLASNCAIDSPIPPAT